MAFGPQFLDEIRSRVTLSDVVARRVKLIRRGREHTGLCPFHNEKTPSFTVNDDKSFFHCFGCGAHGDVIGFVMRTEGLSFPEAVERLAADAGLQVPVASPEERVRAKARETLHGVNEAACAWFEKQLRSAHGRHALDYLKGRGLTDETIARFRLGFAPDGRDALRAALLKQGIDEALLLEGGLIGRPDDGRAPYDRFRGRVMFPITDRAGRVIAFGGRIIGEGQPKYLNSPDTPLFNKGHVLYGLAAAREAIHKAQEAIVVEGYMDVIALHQAGIKTAVAPLGTALTEQQIELLWRMAPEPVLCFDGDAAGQRAAQRAAERALPLLKPGHSLRFALLPPGDDPDSLVRGGGALAMRDVLAKVRPLVDLLWERETVGKPIGTPEQRADLWVSLANVAATVANKEVQFAYSSEFKNRYFDLFREIREKNLRKKFDRISLICDGYVQILGKRVNEAVILILVYHPEVIEEFQETIMNSKLEYPELDEIRRLILAFANQSYATAEEMNVVSIKDYLYRRHAREEMERILSETEKIYVHAKFAHPLMPLRGARIGLKHLLNIHYSRVELDRMIKTAELDLAGNSSERAMQVLQDLLHLKHQLADDISDEEWNAFEEDLRQLDLLIRRQRLDRERQEIHLRYGSSGRT